MSHYTIGALADQLGITVRTLQYYDRKGLLTAKRTAESNRRYYNEDDVQQLQLISLLKEFGCTLDEIKTLLYEDSDMQTLKTMLQLHKEALQTHIYDQTKALQHINDVEQYISDHSSAPINHLSDIDKAMKQSTTLKTFRKKVWMSAGVIGIIQYTGLIASLLRSSSKPFVSILPILVTYAIGLTTFYYKNISYLCPNCQHTFKPSVKQFIVARHTMQTRKLPCPNCHETHYCIEVSNEKK
ncbi:MULTISPECIES: MerR family transcriptional regulator [unclassified Staphylococcus]|uniref:MerR family transcriptional regulator n=1 Tax=unclassified Staphylococcus TaxID=91994 RepID=UPI00187EB036|nr:MULTISPECIES: MerR family transcriptional regulator [unclassified Staphylococcus]MBF2757545.1 MerR family transcriptional regulator [Staphylococcus haemolyticus]MBF2773991.1 MerR family transcriptional regulator [Staphylococcus haemolyticus]MBF2776570.1 MerR family transcriptional regulator [Staphylococcus haemolyticus]MBF2815846.1 MerR family transcriptional regulator [Staphylococcus haemolyticus]MBF9719434.1 MerR family transcriptional regulator [Staphylococcus haemolyticus]